MSGSRRAPRGLSRRRFLGISAAVGVGLVLPGCSALREQTGALVTSLGARPTPFAVPLPVPPVLAPVRTTADADHYLITQRVGHAEIIPGLRTPVLGYDGIFPGPTIESRSGRTTVVTHRNELTIPTVVHLHGGHTPAEHDGYPLDLLLPVGETEPPGYHAGHGADGGVAGIASGEREHVYPMRQRAATLWYHDHRMDFTGPAVYRGLLGMHVVRDDVEDGLGLPAGERELPLIICDRSFEEDGSFRYPAVDPGMTTMPGVQAANRDGVLGDVLLVNGAPWPELEVDAARYRFRVVNGSNARRYGLRLDPPPPEGPSFVQVGSDGGLLAAPVEHDRLDVAAGERFDLVVDFARWPVGTVVVLTNVLGESDGTRSVMRFRVARRASDSSTVPSTLSEVEPLVAGPRARTRTFDFTRGLVGDHDGFTINGARFDPARTDADPVLGEVERWRFVSDLHHPVHVHLDQFQVSRRAANDSGAYDAGWKDTVDVRPGEIVEVLVRFTEHVGRFVMHCHNLEHEDMAMMANVVTSA